MDESHQHSAIEALRDWSKWLITFDFAAATGCIVVLLGGAEGAPRVFLLAAIIAFAASVLASILLVRMLAGVVEHLPVRDASGQAMSVQHYRLAPGLTLGALSWLQFALLALALIFLVAWLLLRPTTV